MSLPSDPSWTPPQRKGAHAKPADDDVVEIKRVKSANTFYKQLAIPVDATEDDVRKAYHKLARKLHPDKNTAPFAEEAFKMVSDAYEVLKDPRMRQRYDTALANGEEWRDQKDYGNFGGGVPLHLRPAIVCCSAATPCAAVRAAASAPDVLTVRTASGWLAVRRRRGRPGLLGEFHRARVGDPELPDGLRAVRWRQGHADLLREFAPLAQQPLMDRALLCAVNSSPPLAFGVTGAHRLLPCAADAGQGHHVRGAQHRPAQRSCGGALRAELHAGGLA